MSKEMIARIVRDVAEQPDRNSPDDHTGLMRVWAADPLPGAYAMRIPIQGPTGQGGHEGNN